MAARAAQPIHQIALRCGELAPVVAVDRVQRGAEERGQELVPTQFIAPSPSPEYEMSLEVAPRPRRRGNPRVVRLLSADRDQRVGTRTDGVGAQHLSFAGLVSAQPESGQVVALDEQSPPTWEQSRRFQWCVEDGDRHA